MSNVCFVCRWCINKDNLYDIHNDTMYVSKKEMLCTSLEIESGQWTSDSLLRINKWAFRVLLKSSNLVYQFTLATVTNSQLCSVVNFVYFILFFLLIFQVIFGEYVFFNFHDGTAGCEQICVQASVVWKLLPFRKLNEEHRRVYPNH